MDRIRTGPSVGVSPGDSGTRHGAPRRHTKKERFRLFARYAEMHLGRRVDDDVLHAALAAVRLRAKQASSKLSPVARGPKTGGARRSITPIAPHAASTYAPFASCPDSCGYLRDGGCYVDANPFQRKAVAALGDRAQTLPPEHRADLIALAEAWKVATYKWLVDQDGHRGGRDLRLHAAGDVTTALHAKLLAEAAEIWEVCEGGKVWTFTHSWARIPRAAFGLISTMASVDAIGDVPVAMARGFAVSTVVDAFPDGKNKFVLQGLPDVTFVPCPYEAGVRSPRTAGLLTCVECRMCLDDERRRNLRQVIAFQVHGSQASAAKATATTVRPHPAGAKRRLPVFSHENAATSLRGMSRSRTRKEREMKRQTHDAAAEGRDHSDDSEPEDTELDAIVEALNEIYETSTLDYYTRLGEYLVEVMFDGTTEHLAERRSQTSWRDLASHKDLRESPSTLWYAVRIYSQVLDLPDGLGKQLNASQHRRLVAVKERSDKIRLARQCVSEKWTVGQLEDEIAKLKKPSGRGGMRVPPHIKALQRLPKVLGPALEQHVTAEDIAAVGRNKMLELRAKLWEHIERLNEAVKEMDGALERCPAPAEEGNR